MKMCRTPREDDFEIIKGEEIIGFKNYIKRIFQSFSSVGLIEK